MFDLSGFAVDFLSNWMVASIAALFILGAAGVHLYYRTNPPVPRLIRGLLLALRLVAILALVLVLLQPVIGYTRQFERPTRVAVLLDRSGSMNRIEQKKSRSERLDSLLTSPGFSYLQNNVDIRRYYFGGNLTSKPDNVDTNRTALGDALNSLEQLDAEHAADLLIVFSDGKSNAGKDISEAAVSLSRKVVAVNLAGRSEEFDVGIESIDCNPILFAGRPTEIKVTLDWQNAIDKQVTVELVDSNRVVQQKKMTIDQEVGHAEFSLSYLPDRPGQRILRVRIPALAQERSIDNNSRSVAVKVLKSRLLVLLMTDKPDYEVGFLRRFLASSDKYEVELKVTGPRSGNMLGRFPSRQTELNRYDLVILHDPDPNKLAAHRDVITDYLNKRGGSIWLLMGSQFALSRPLEWFNRLLPFSPSHSSKAEYREFRGQPSESQLFHPAVRLADSREGIRSAWADMPPFHLLVRCDDVDPEGVILAYGSAATGLGTRLPIMGFERHGPGKLLASAALPFWTWKFISIGFGDDQSRYDRLVDGIASWLTVSEDFEPVRIAPERKVYSRGELVRFDGHAFDQGYRPLSGVTGHVKMTRTDRKYEREVDLLATGEGTYRADCRNLAPGSYTYAAEFSQDGQVLKQSRGEIVVEPFSLEELDQSGDEAALMTLARLSGGKYCRYEGFDDAIGELNLEPVRETLTNELTLWNRLFLMIVIVSALSLEWLLRKVYQLI
ncbi:MAG: hypothetical protein ACE5FH_09045 [Candidatus Zixiibacteriota bacterium]